MKTITQKTLSAPVCVCVCKKLSALLLAFLLPLVVFAQNNVTVSGTILDEQDMPVVGATVAVVGQANKGALSDLDGHFSITGIPANSTLRISYVGYKTQEIALAGQTSLNIKLIPDSELLDEVVVVGYGTQKKVNLTGSVSQIGGDKLEARPVQNIGQALQGAVPGLNLDVNTSGGGALDSRMSLNVRGQGTIGQGSASAPLVLIDGTEGDLFSLSPNDIESISVLKDASSSAIYGSRAAFGVILVTTKSGREGKPKVAYNGNFRFSTATQVPQMLDAYTFANYWNIAGVNAGQGVKFSDEMMQKIKDNMEGKLPPEEASGTKWHDYKANEPWWMYTSGWANTDWFQEQYRKNAPSTEHSLSVSGGTAKINYMLSGAFMNQNGLIRHGKDTFNRYNLSGKFSAELAPWLTVGYNTRWVREDYSRPSFMTGLFFHNIARSWPTNALRDPNGHYTWTNHNIQQMEDGGKDIRQTDRLYQQVTAEFRPLDGWMIRLEGNYRIVNDQDHWDILPVGYHDPNEAFVPMTWDGNLAAGATRVSESMSKSNYFNVRAFTQYAKVFNEVHDFKAIAGMDMEANEYQNLSVRRDDLITPEIPTLNTTTNKDAFPGFGKNHWATMGFFGRINYAYDNRYLAEFSIRRDGSSRFIGDKTWATFPSVSLGWNIANEKFFKPATAYIEMLKLRGSWGALGNTNTNSLYPWFLGQPVSTSANSNWLINGERIFTSNVPGLVSPNLTWERVQSWNIGVDFSLFRYRLQGSFDYFVRNTFDMVGPSEPVPSILGAGQPKLNNADMKSYGWELELKWRDSFKDFNYGFRFVLSDDRQVITRYYNPRGMLNDWYEGKEVGTIWGFRTKGIAQTTEEMTEHLKNNKPTWGDNWDAGDIMYENTVDPIVTDPNSELYGQVDPKRKGIVSSGAGTLDDHDDYEIIGNSRPHFRYSFNADFAWKGIDLAIFLQGIGKRDFMDNSTYFTGANVGMWQAVGFREHLDFWRPADTDPKAFFGPNPDAYYPRPLFNKGGKNFQSQTRFLQDASYLRIKNLQVGYTLPQAWTQKAGISRLRIYFSGDNLYTFTKLSKIFDPEATGGAWGAGKLYPLQRTLSVGVNLNF